MKKHLFISGLVFCVLTGCNTQYRRFETSSKPKLTRYSTLSEQQAAAYPMLSDNEYLTLSDFEDKSQINEFNLSRENGATGRSRIFYSSSPTATGIGAMGIFFGTRDNYTLSFDTPIGDFRGFNMLLCAMYLNDNRTDLRIELIDSGGKSFSQKYLLHKAWNKLEVDLGSAKNHLKLANVKEIKFHFTGAGNSTVFIDDILLVDYIKTLLGSIDGPEGKMFAVKDGKQFRIGAGRRFELVFSGGKIVGWYDLKTDSQRINNLAPAAGLGPVVYQNNLQLIPPANTVVNVKTKISEAGQKHLRVRAELYFGKEIRKGHPDQEITYDIFSDGVVLLNYCTGSEGNKLGMCLSVDRSQGFEFVKGKIHNPEGSRDSQLEYALFRRMGKRQGADLLFAVKPLKSNLSVKCTLLKSQGGKVFHAVCVSKAEPGKNCIKAMMRLWPVDIDNIGKAEQYAREFFFNSPEPLNEIVKPVNLWNPSFSGNLKE